MSDSKKSSREKIVLLISALVLFTSGYFLVNGDFSFNSSSNNSGPKIGTVKSVHNKASHRHRDDLSWKEAHVSRPLQNGDSIFTARASSATVELINKGEVVIGENSLVQFDLNENEKVLEFKEGNFLLKVDGKINVAVNGEVSTIEGSGSQVQLFVRKNEIPKVTLVKGQATVTKKKTQVKTELPVRKVASLAPELETKPLPAPAPEVAAQPVAPFVTDSTPVPSAPLPKEPPRANTQQFEVVYYWKFYDHFEISNKQLRMKEFSPQSVLASQFLSWGPKSEGMARVEISKNSDFSSSTIKTTPEDHLQLNEVFLGKNYWRVSYSPELMSQTESFVVNPQFLPNSTPIAKKSDIEVLLKQNEVQVSIDLQSPIETRGYIVQVSGSTRFEPQNTRLFGTGDQQVKFDLKNTGTYYARFKAVSMNSELSPWSNPVRILVKAPPAPLLKLAKDDSAKATEKKKEAERKIASIEKTQGAQLAQENLQIAKLPDIELGKNSLIVEPFGIYSMYNGSTSSIDAKVVSDLGTGVRATYLRRADDDSEYFGSISAYNIKFRSDRNQTYTFETSSASPLSMNFGYKRQLSSRFNLGVGVFYEDSLFFEQGAGTNTVSILKVQNKGVMAKPEWILYRRPDWDFVTGGTVSLLLPASMGNETSILGMSYDYGLLALRKQSWGKVYGGASFGQRFQKAGSISYSETYLQYRFGLFYPF